jgi:hypothetical protein
LLALRLDHFVHTGVPETEGGRAAEAIQRQWQYLGT